MTRAAKIERRIHPRVDHELPIRVAANGYDFATSTDNVSCVGAYCTINKYVPPFTKVMIKLTLPIQEEANKEKRTVECKGVIVRTDDQDKGGFNIAIFFNEIAEEQKKKIAKYINQLLPN
ncbi:MAG: PilZ domain-containing protein [Candidatus Omnitrophota bacterium]|nr:PilZ domain-containing protein [Candidatus Omnitrophota bacterium]